MLEDLVEYGYWQLTCLRNNQGWENNFKYYGAII